MVPSTKHVLTPYHLLPFISPLQVHELEAMLRAGAWLHCHVASINAASIHAGPHTWMWGCS